MNSLMYALSSGMTRGHPSGRAGEEDTRMELVSEKHRRTCRKFCVCVITQKDGGSYGATKEGGACRGVVSGRDAARGVARPGGGAGQDAGRVPRAVSPAAESARGTRAQGRA